MLFSAGGRPLRRKSHRALPQVFARVDVLFPALGEQHSNVGGVRPASLPTTGFRNESRPGRAVP